VGAGRLAGIEGIRALAACWVLAFHVWDDTDGVKTGPVSKAFLHGTIGVTLFFVLSGFLLYRPFAGAVVRGAPRPSVRRYALNRALRILPAYWVILLLVALLLDRALIEKPLRLLGNLALIQNYIPAYQPVGKTPLGVAPAWSVVVEFSFYVVLPVLAVLAGVLVRRVSSVWAALAPPLLLLSVGFAAFIAFRLFPERLGMTFEKFTFPIYASWFGVGMSLAVIRVLWELGRVGIARWWPPVAVAGGVGVILLSTKLSYAGVLDFGEYQFVVACGLAALMTLVVLTSRRNAIVRFLEWSPVVAVGLASYSLFLWNDPIIRKLRDNDLLLAGWSGIVVNLVVVGTLTGAASWLTFRFVEKRALALKRRAEPAAEPIDAEPLGSIEPRDLNPDPAPSH
jgi:peptidoglycan/LPS O-acetylase OafA/YrhL